MIREYDRPLTESEKRTLKKQIEEIRSEMPDRWKTTAKVSLGVISSGVLIYVFPKVWLIVILSIASLFMIWYLYDEISALLRLPKFLSDMQETIDNGITDVVEINIDRYIKIDNYEDEGDHFIVEYSGMVNLIGGQEFLGVRRLKNKIEQIQILDAERSGIYYEKIKKSGEKLIPYYTFKKGLSDELIHSEIWDHLTNQEPFSGTLEDLDHFIEQDKRKSE